MDNVWESLTADSITEYYSTYNMRDITCSLHLLPLPRGRIMQHHHTEPSAEEKLEVVPEILVGCDNYKRRIIWT